MVVCSSVTSIMLLITAVIQFNEVISDVLFQLPDTFYGSNDGTPTIRFEELSDGHRAWVPSETFRRKWLTVDLQRTRLIRAVNILGWEKGFATDVSFECSLDGEYYEAFRNGNGEPYENFLIKSPIITTFRIWIQACRHVKLIVHEYRHTVAVGLQILEALGMREMQYAGPYSGEGASGKTINSTGGHRLKTNTCQTSGGLSEVFGFLGAKEFPRVFH